MKALAEQIEELDGVEIYGRVVGVRGLMVEVAGPIHAMSVGARLTIESAPGKPIPCEVVGFHGGHALAMPFAALEGVRRGCRAVVSTAAGFVPPSDEPALMRRQAAYLTLAIAEFFRDMHKDVLVLMDSVTRFAMAQREIGLSAGEPPTAKGYTPTVFTELPRLLERAGPGTDEGTITGIFSVLVEGDDPNEPVADAVRAILDGHIVMERAIAERGRFPAINVLKSVSRTMPKAADPAYLPLILRGRQVMATYADMEELIRLGAYRQGSSPEVDEAIALHEPLEAFLRQDKEEVTGLSAGYRQLAQILGSLETER